MRLCEQSAYSLYVHAYHRTKYCPIPSYTGCSFCLVSMMLAGLANRSHTRRRFCFGRPSALRQQPHMQVKRANMPHPHTRFKKKTYKLRVRVTASEPSARYPAEARLTHPRLQKQGRKYPECSQT